MKTKLKDKITRSYLEVDVAILGVLSCAAFFFNIYLGIIGLVAAAAVTIFHKFNTEKKVLAAIEEYKEQEIKNRESLFDALTLTAPIFICILDRNKSVQWTNKEFDNIFKNNSSFTEMVEDKSFDEIFNYEKSSINKNIDGKIYKLSVADYSKAEDGLRLIFGIDISKESEYKEKLEDSLVCAAYVNLDNVEEVMQDTPIENRVLIIAQIENEILSWARGLEAAVFKVDSNKYSLIFKANKLIELKKNKFDILNQIRSIEVSPDFPASLSIGIGVGENNLEKLQENASEALDLALGRGGDQVAIRNIKGEVEFFGGTLPSVEKRTKAKSYVTAHALSRLIKDSNNVLIMGHKSPDMDSFGSCIGMYALAKNMKKEAYIVLGSQGDGIDSIYNVAKDIEDEKGEKEYQFVSHERAKQLVDDKTLLILLDHHRELLTECPEVLEKGTKVAVIDHHRKAGDGIEDTVISFIESYASSASELVTELLQSLGEVGEISKFEAEALLAGIALDTKSFTSNTGVRTFEAASWLKRNGADIGNVRVYFKQDFSFYQKKIKMLANAEIIENKLAVAYTKEIDSSMQILISQVADELMEMKDVDVSVVSGQCEEGISLVSARSNGKVNVQTLMEEIGGGGHQRSAAVRLELGPEEAIGLVVSKLREEHII